MGCPKGPGPSMAGQTPAFYLSMKELSIFVDESGDFGEYEKHSPYYILSFVFHDQDKNIGANLEELNQKLIPYGINNQAIHTGPLIRQEREYFSMELPQRQKIMKLLLAFFRNVDIKCKSIYVEKKVVHDDMELIASLSKELSRFINNHLNYFLSFDEVKIYYDKGQYPVTVILSSVFNALLTNVKFKVAVKPSDYRLFQVADMLCSMELVRLKMNNKDLSKSELRFFSEPRIIRKRYLKTIDGKTLK